MKMFTIDSERQFKWENIVSDTNCESLNQIAYFSWGSITIGQKIMWKQQWKNFLDKDKT